MRKIKIKTLWQDRAWVADHILNDCLKKGEGIILEYKKEGLTMTISPDRLDPKFWLKGQEQYRDKFNRNPYRLYGIHFVKDEKIQESLF